MLGEAFNPVNPTGDLTPLDTFAGQVQQFAAQDGTFTSKHFLVSNSPDVTLTPILSSAEFQASGATIAGIQSLVSDFNT